MHDNNNSLEIEIVQLGGLIHVQIISLMMKPLPVSYSSLYIKIEYFRQTWQVLTIEPSHLLEKISS